MSSKHFLSQIFTDPTRHIIATFIKVFIVWNCKKRSPGRADRGDDR